MTPWPFQKKEPLWTDERLAVLKWPDRPTVLDGDTIDEFIESYPLVAIDFWAAWCHPCKKFGTKVASLAKELKGTVAFGKLNVEKHKETAKRYHVGSLPTLLVFKDGKRVDGVRGNVKWSQAERMLMKYIEGGNRR